jgi:hypothetical protein
MSFHIVDKIGNTEHKQLNNNLYIKLIGLLPKIAYVMKKIFYFAISEIHIF